MCSFGEGQAFKWRENLYSTGASIAKWGGAPWSKVGSWGLGAFCWHYATNPDNPLVLDAINALYADGNNNV